MRCGYTARIEKFIFERMQILKGDNILGKFRYRIRFGDGIIRKIFFIEEDPQTGGTLLWFHRRRDKSKLLKPDSWKYAIVLPASSLIGLNSKYSSKMKYCLCCHTHDSRGREILGGADDLTILTRDLIAKENQLGFMEARIASLQHDNRQLLKGRGEVIDEMAGSIKKIADSGTPPRRYYRRPQEQAYVPPDFPDEEGE